MNDLAVVHIHMAHSTVVTTQLMERYGPVDKLGVVGGLFGLFLGFSLLSAVELAYWTGRGGHQLYKSEETVIYSRKNEKLLCKKSLF